MQLIRFQPASPAGPQVLSGEGLAHEVAGQVVRSVLQAAAGPRAAPLVETVHETIYTEQARLDRGEPTPRDGADRAFLAHLRHQLARADEARQRALVREVVERYAGEIAGHFDGRVYAVATRLLPGALGAALGGGDVEQRLLLEGEVAALVSLCRHGTVLLAPTHASNLDSLVFGWAIYRLGLPPFAYAAGLNLYGNPALGFFMRHLGAYTVDRAKTDPLYRATLKEYATTLTARGQHGLFFPGGTRSRSGRVETHLKLGLLGAAPLAYRRALEEGRAHPRVFVVPCTVTYPLVLEAASLVEDYLRREGGPHYVDLADEFDRPRRWSDFFRGLAARDLRVHVRFGQARDPVGNPVDGEGVSRDPQGRALEPRDYFTVHGALTPDPERDAAYTRAVAERLLDSYHRDTVALPTSALAWVVFALVRQRLRQPDLFRLLRALGPRDAVGEAEVTDALGALLERLRGLAQQGALQLADELGQARVGQVVQRALDTFATYHRVPVLERRQGRLRVLDPNLLFYYRNRLDGPALAGGGAR